jgi:hypothetical protein
MKKHCGGESRKLEVQLFDSPVDAKWEVLMALELTWLANSRTTWMLIPLKWISVTTKLVPENLEPALTVKFIDPSHPCFRVNG